MSTTVPPPPLTAVAYDVTGTKNMFWSMAETESVLNLNPRDAMHPMVAERPQDLNRQRLEICVNFWNIFRTTDGGIKMFQYKDSFISELHNYLHGTTNELTDGGGVDAHSGNRFLLGENASVANIIQNFLFERFNKKIALTSFSPLRVKALFDNNKSNSYYTPSNCSASLFTKTQLGEIFDDATRDGVDWMIQGNLVGDPNEGYYVPDIRNGDRFGITLCVKIDDDQKGDVKDLSIDGEYVSLNDNYKSFNIVFAHDEKAPSNLTSDVTKMETDTSGEAVYDTNTLLGKKATDEIQPSIDNDIPEEEDVVSSLWYTVQSVGYGYNTPSTDVSGNAVDGTLNDNDTLGNNTNLEGVEAVTATGAAQTPSSEQSQFA